MTTPHPLAQVNQAAECFCAALEARETELQAILRRNAERIREQDTEEDQHNGR